MSLSTDEPTLPQVAGIEVPVTLDGLKASARNHTGQRPKHRLCSCLVLRWIRISRRSSIFYRKVR